MFVVGVTMPTVMGQLALQIVYFVAIFSGVAWARDRRGMLVVVGRHRPRDVRLDGAGSSRSATASRTSSTTPRAPSAYGLVAPIPAAVAADPRHQRRLLRRRDHRRPGRLARRPPARPARASRRAPSPTQAERCARRAVIDERLRIARELHDVVAPPRLRHRHPGRRRPARARPRPRGRGSGARPRIEGSLARGRGPDARPARARCATSSGPDDRRRPARARRAGARRPAGPRREACATPARHVELRPRRVPTRCGRPARRRRSRSPSTAPSRRR